MCLIKLWCEQLTLTPTLTLITTDVTIYINSVVDIFRCEGFMRVWKFDISLWNGSSPLQLLQEPCSRQETARSRVNFGMQSQWETSYGRYRDRNKRNKRENSAFFDDRTHIWPPPHQRVQTNIGIRLRSPETRQWARPTSLPLTIYAHLRLF